MLVTIGCLPFFTSCITKLSVLAYPVEQWAGSSIQSNPRQCMGWKEEERKGSFYSYLCCIRNKVLFIVLSLISQMYAFQKCVFFSSPPHPTGDLVTAIRKPESLGYNKILRCNKTRHLRKQ